MKTSPDGDGLAGAIGRVRPGDDVNSLKQALGARWVDLTSSDEGFWWGHRVGLDFTVRVDVRERIGSISFYGTFPPSAVIGGLFLQMAEAQARTAYPDLISIQNVDDATGGIREYYTQVSDAVTLAARFKQGRLVGMDWVNPNAAYPNANAKAWQPAPPGKYPLADATLGSPFNDPNLKLVILNALLGRDVIKLGTPEELAAHVLGRAVDLEDEGWARLPEAHDYLQRYPLSAAQLAQVDTIVFDGGLDIYRYAWYHWDGESDEFDVRSLDGIERCTALKHFTLIAMANGLDLARLAAVRSLQSVELYVDCVNSAALLALPELRSLECFARSLDDLTVIETLRARGVKVVIR